MTQIKEGNYKKGAVGITPTYITICLTDSVQVDRHGEHFESDFSEGYFNE